MISDSFHILRIIHIAFRYITSIRGGHRTEEGCFVAEYQNAVNQTFLAGNRGGRNPLFVHSASLQELTNGGRGEETDEGRNQGQPWSCVEQCADSPPDPVARAKKKPTRSRRPLSHDSSYDRYRFPFQSLFCLHLGLSPSPATLSASLPPRVRFGMILPKLRNARVRTHHLVGWRTEKKERDAEGWRAGMSSSRTRSPLYMCPNGEGLILIACDIRKWWDGDLE